MNKLPNETLGVLHLHDFRALLQAQVISNVQGVQQHQRLGIQAVFGGVGCVWMQRDAGLTFQLHAGRQRRHQHFAHRTHVVRGHPIEQFNLARSHHGLFVDQGFDGLGCVPCGARSWTSQMTPVHFLWPNGTTTLHPTLGTSSIPNQLYVNAFGSARGTTTSTKQTGLEADVDTEGKIRVETRQTLPAVGCSFGYGNFHFSPFRR